MLRNSLAKQKPNFRELNPGKQQSQCYCPTMQALIHRHSSLFDGTRRIVSLTDGCLFVTGAGPRTLGECPSLRVRAMRTHSIGSLWQPHSRAVEKQRENFLVLDTTMSRDHKATRWEHQAWWHQAFGWKITTCYRTHLSSALSSFVCRVQSLIPTGAR